MAFQSITTQHIDAANLIIQAFILVGKCVILLAQMQAGKTYVFLLVLAEMIRLGYIDSVIIFSGNAELDLKKQLADKVYGIDNEFYDAYQKYLIKELYKKYSNPAMEQVMKAYDEACAIVSKIKANIQVIWGTELKKFNKNVTRTLLIWEESHFAQSVSQCPDKFLKRLNISPNGDVKSDNFMLTVSATPFSELSDNIRYFQNKNVVYLNPGEGYNSVKIIRNSGKLISYNSVECALTSALSTLNKTTQPKYGLVRITKNEHEIIQIIKNNNWDYVIYDSVGKEEEIKKSREVWNNMDNAPTRNTVILLRGMCKMGKNLKKSHILFVMETAKTSNTDTVLQGLLGRVCGYSTGSDKIYVYLHEKIINSGEINRYIELTDNLEENREINILPIKAKNIAKKQPFYKNKTIIPIKIKRNRDISVTTNEKDIKNDAFDAVFNNPHRCINKNSPEDYDEVRVKYLNAWNSCKKNIRVFYLALNKSTRGVDKGEKLQRAFNEGESTNLGSGCGHSLDGLQINIWINKNIDNLADFDSETFYITCAVSDNKSKQRYIPNTTKKEVFAHAHSLDLYDDAETETEIINFDDCAN
jgi:hypothetical protein